VIGYSDISTIITPLTVRTGVATVHGNNLLDTPYRPPAGLLSWLDIVTMAPGTTFTQSSPGRYRAVGYDDYRDVPEVSEFTLNTAARWVRLDGTGDVDVTGRLIGGCVETLCNLTGTPFGDLSGYELVYVEAAGHDAATIARHLHGMRLAGWFADARAVLVGRTRAPDTDTLTQKEAVLDALGGLGVPIVADVERGHTQPFLPIVNGAIGRIVCSVTVNELAQTLA
jgi:muramoyltetrapeptide carboxypeptidase LdcA involved in peptidoglycan recycling